MDGRVECATVVGGRGSDLAQKRGWWMVGKWRIGREYLVGNACKRMLVCGW